MAKGVSKKKKLPDRYPREKEIMVILNMTHLDHVCELLDQMGKNLISQFDPDQEWDDEAQKLWDILAADPLTHLISQLRRAFIEYERFWQPEGWTIESDFELNEALEDYTEMWWRLNDVRQGCWRMPRDNEGPTKGEPFRAYDPALEACAEALFIALAFQQSTIGDQEIRNEIRDLKSHLTRYYAASLEILMGRDGSVLFSPGRAAGAHSLLHRYLKQLYQKLYWERGAPLDFDSFWNAIGAECLQEIRGIRPLTLQETNDDTLFYSLGSHKKSVGKVTLRNKFSLYKRGELDRYLQQLWSSLALPVPFERAWEQIKAECEEPVRSPKWLALQRVDDQLLHYQEGKKSFSTSKRELRHTFTVFKNEKLKKKIHY